MLNRKTLLAALGGFFAGAMMLAAADGTIVTWTGKGSRRSTVEMTIASPSMGSAANLVPGTAGANSLGTTGYYWKDVISAKHGFGVATSTVGVTPDYAGQMMLNQAYEVVIATAANQYAWVKVGAQ